MIEEMKGVFLAVWIQFESCFREDNSAMQMEFGPLNGYRRGVMFVMLVAN